MDIGDKLDVICPIRDKPGNDEAYYLTLYQVDYDSFLSCSINKKKMKRLLLCNMPEREKKYTFLFQEISPSPWGLTFKTGKTYYYICKYYTCNLINNVNNLFVLKTDYLVFQGIIIFCMIWNFMGRHFSCCICFEMPDDSVCYAIKCHDAVCH